jgi:putative oxidoreductase
MTYICIINFYPPKNKIYMNTKVLLGLRILLGLLYTVFGFNFFFHFIPAPPPSGEVGTLMGIMFTSGWLTVVKVIEIIGGISLLTNQYSRLSAIILMPVTVNILIFHTLLAGNPAMAIIMLLINAAILYGYKDDLIGTLKRN